MYFFPECFHGLLTSLLLLIPRLFVLVPILVFVFLSVFFGYMRYTELVPVRLSAHVKIVVSSYRIA